MRLITGSNVEDGNGGVFGLNGVAVGGRLVLRVVLGAHSISDRLHGVSDGVLDGVHFVKVEIRFVDLGSSGGS